MKLTREQELKLREARIRVQRLRLQSEIGAALAEQRTWYEQLKAAAPEAGLYRSAPMGRRLDATRTLELDIALMLDESTPTARFEKARAHIEHISGFVLARRRQETKLAAELDRIREELGRIARAAGGPVPDSQHAPWGAVAGGPGRPLQARLPACYGERLDSLRALARAARNGLPVLR